LFADGGTRATRADILALHSQTERNVRQALRAATARAHAALEEIVGPLTNLAAYTHYARGLHAFRAALEPQVLPIATQFSPRYRPTQIADLLAEDLDDLHATPSPPASMMIEDMAEALGALYVLEGSGLGARVLVKQVQALGLTQSFGARHLWRQAASLEAWREFLVFLEGAAVDLDRIVTSANATFDLARDCMIRSHQNG
jgi:heme oxygenase